MAGRYGLTAARQADVLPTADARLNGKFEQHKKEDRSVPLNSKMAGRSLAGTERRQKRRKRGAGFPEQVGQGRKNGTVVRSRIVDPGDPGTTSKIRGHYTYFSGKT